MKQFILNAQAICLIALGLCTLFILGAEPSSSSEESLSNYAHAMDKGNFGWYLCWGWVTLVVLFLTLTAIRYYHSINEK
jgi:hypothetical protein